MSEDDDAVRVREWDVDEYEINYNAVVAKCRRIQATVDRLLTEREAVEAERARQESAFYRELRRREKAEADNDRLVGTLAVMAKASKQSVRYEHPAKIPAHNCGRCVHFQKPDKCEKVSGVIRREDWCKLWRLR